MSSFSLGKIFLFATIFLASISSAFCNQENDSLSSLEKKAYDPVPDIMHHISDSHEWHFWGEGESAVTLSLPIILWTDNGLVGPFSSSKFHHNDNGQIAVIVDGHSLVKIHNKIYELNQGQKSAVFDESHHIKNGILPLYFSITCFIKIFLSA